MSVELFENKLRAFPVVLNALEACSNDICARCIGLEGAKIKLGKLLKKLGMDVKSSSIPEDKKNELMIKINDLSKRSEELQVADECVCQKTAGNCKIGSGCFVNGAVDLISLVTEPKE
ncbi:MAG: hypothetical protein ABIH76_04055 [Candidatus Bathyarchaeota archaeon]